MHRLRQHRQGVPIRRGETARRRREMTTPRTPAEIGGMGHSVKRKEDPRFLRGQGTYVDDIVLPDMLYLDIIRSPYAHAKITNIDTSKALAIPGVASAFDVSMLVILAWA